jgi:hypothetical protein
VQILKTRHGEPGKPTSAHFHQNAEIEQSNRTIISFSHKSRDRTSQYTHAGVCVEILQDDIKIMEVNNPIFTKTRDWNTSLRHTEHKIIEAFAVSNTSVP